MKLYMGIEGIGTRYSVAAVSDESGKLISCVRLNLPLSLHTTPRPELRARLARLMRAVLQPIDLRLDELENTTLCIGLSGVTFPYNALVDVPRQFEKMNISLKELIATPDTHIILASHIQAKQGSVVTCSMGSMAYVSSELGGIRYGGWGPALGDEGSGYWMGRTVLRKILEEADTGREESILWREVEDFLNDPERPLPQWQEYAILWKQQIHRFQRAQFKHYNFDRRTAIFSFVHNLSMRSTADWRSLASSLVIPLMRAWDKKDRTATQIVMSAAKALKTQFNRACDRAKVRPDHGPLVLYGGVFTHNPNFQALVQERIRGEKYAHLKVVVPGDPHAMRPVCGALLFALGGSKTGHLRLPEAKVIRRLVVDQEELHSQGALAND